MHPAALVRSSKCVCASIQNVCIFVARRRQSYEQPRSLDICCSVAQMSCCSTAFDPTRTTNSVACSSQPSRRAPAALITEHGVWRVWRFAEWLRCLPSIAFSHDLEEMGPNLLVEFPPENICAAVDGHVLRKSKGSFPPLQHSSRRDLAAVYCAEVRTERPSSMARLRRQHPLGDAHCVRIESRSQVHSTGQTVGCSSRPSPRFRLRSSARFSLLLSRSSRQNL